MAFRAEFTAIDFETANRRRDSACQLAAVVVRDGKLCDQRMWMIRPDPFFFSPGNIRIHGIHPADVEDEPTFGQCWPEIAEFLGDDCLIAHNASFDIGVLLGCLQRHQCDIPELHFSCTRLIARETWPDRRRFGLKPLANWLGVEFRHHDALEDSRACAKILLAAGIARQATSFEDLENRLRIVRGKAGPWGVSGAGRQGQRKRHSTKRKTEKGAAGRILRRGSVRPLRTPAPDRSPVNPFDEPAMLRESPPAYSGDGSRATPPTQSNIDWQRLSIRAEFIQPLRGKQIVICGRLTMISNEQAIEITSRGGGAHQASVDEATNCILVGDSEVDREAVGALAAGKSIEVLTESDFLRLLGA